MTFLNELFFWKVTLNASSSSYRDHKKQKTAFLMRQSYLEAEFRLVLA